MDDVKPLVGQPDIGSKAGETVAHPFGRMDVVKVAIAKTAIADAGIDHHVMGEVGALVRGDLVDLFLPTVNVVNRPIQKIAVRDLCHHMTPAFGCDGEAVFIGGKVIQKLSQPEMAQAVEVDVVVERWAVDGGPIFVAPIKDNMAARGLGVADGLQGALQTVAPAVQSLDHHEAQFRHCRHPLDKFPDRLRGRCCHPTGIGIPFS